MSPSWSKSAQTAPLARELGPIFVSLLTSVKVPSPREKRLTLKWTVSLKNQKAIWPLRSSVQGRLLITNWPLKNPGRYKNCVRAWQGDLCSSWLMKTHPAILLIQLGINSGNYGSMTYHCFCTRHFFPQKRRNKCLLVRLHCNHQLLLLQSRAQECKTPLVYVRTGKSFQMVQSRRIHSGAWPPYWSDERGEIPLSEWAKNEIILMEKLTLIRIVKKRFRIPQGIII